MADVPLGVFLSGGVDSSSVAASVVRQRTAANVKTFSIGFEEKSYDESSMARLVAQHLGTEHHERIFTADAMRDVLPRVAAVLDEPFGDASLLPTYLLSEFAREQVTVALGGDGADELLLGYPTFFADAYAAMFSRLRVQLETACARWAECSPSAPRTSASTSRSIRFCAPPMRRLLSGIYSGSAV